jgi:hypothetical protein
MTSFVGIKIFLKFFLVQSSLQHKNLINALLFMLQVLTRWQVLWIPAMQIARTSLRHGVLILPPLPTF